ncbi:hypothetical protein ACM61V_17875 [Sphingomonas sp. TX0543]|uniref:hypothetical protein n=1 Tax=Sphingomonas sp. TX0543 TaxID=3399682 RepID=UPI003AFA064B
MSLVSRCTHVGGRAYYLADLEIAYLPYGKLERHKEAISRFGSGLKAIKAISRALP